MTFDEFWPTEEQLWLGGAETYASRLHPACLMAFAGLGVLDAEAIRRSIGGQRWRKVEPAAGTLSQIGETVVVLGYRAQAHREGSAPYRCVCTSTYVRAGAQWLLAQHQQSEE